jgi:hydrogenase expression/formation protein HypC
MTDMCLAVPVKIEELEGEQAVATLAGNRIQVNTALVPGVKVGDWVLVHAGFAITVVDESDARETFRIFREMEETR